MKENLIRLLRWSEKYTKTDMVYFAENSFWINANTIIVTIFSFILSILFARFVSKEVYGTYQFLLSISSILTALTLTGMNSAVGNAVARGFEKVFSDSIKIQLRFAILPFLASMVLSIYYLLQDNLVLSLGAVAIGLIMPLTNTFNTWGAYMTGKKAFKPIFFYTQIVNLFYFGTMLVPIFWLPQALPLVLVNIVFGLLANFIIYLQVNKKYPPNNQGEEGALKYGKLLSLSNILPIAVFHIDNIVVFHFLGAVELAIYSFASNIPDRFMSLLRPVPTIAFPKFAEMGESGVGRVLLQKLYRFLLAAVIAGLIYILAAPYIFHYLFPQYQDSLLFSQVYVAVSALSVVTSLSTTALFATRSPKIYITNVVNPLVGISTVILGGYFFGMWGVIGSRVISNAFNLVTTTYFIKRG
jgi:O-antigen/teichoic acid export membrane protein